MKMNVSRRSLSVRFMILSVALWIVGFGMLCLAGPEGDPAARSWTAPAALRTVLENSARLTVARGRRLPLYILPISNSLQGSSDEQAEEFLTRLAERGIGYTVPWNFADRQKSLAEGLRIARIARRVGLPVAADATGCIDGFFDGSPETLHTDERNQRFADLSFDPGRKIGCPFGLGGRVPIIREQVEFFLRGYAKAQFGIEMVFADWEIDGPSEWNDAWAHSKKCQRCQAEIPGLNDFRVFQKRVRTIRSELQREAFVRPVRAVSPQALIGNYGVYPHGGYRYWYDYYERLPEGAPFLTDQKARYREWAEEFNACGYSMAMPVVYTWYPIFHWYDFPNGDYRWFYNGLLVGSNAGQHSAHSNPILTFVHRTITAPPPNADHEVLPLSSKAYQALLWHLLLRGHDGFFLWCLAEELAEETRLLHEVYAESMHYLQFLNDGEPVTFDVPKRQGAVVSGMRLGNRILTLRTGFDPGPGNVIRLPVQGRELAIPPEQEGLKVFGLQ